MKTLDYKIENSLGILNEAQALSKQNKGRMLMTSSFQTQSVTLLHLISEYFPETEVVFLDTGYLFAETYSFVEELIKRLKLNVKVLRSDISYLEQLNREGLFLYATDPDHCCRINKVEPLKRYLKDGDVWISGVRKDQTSFRAGFLPIEKNEKSIKVHPMLEWNSRDIYNYIKINSLPMHPLEFASFTSLGCVPCTNPCQDGRFGRWEGKNKTECGLHVQKDGGS